MVINPIGDKSGGFSVVFTSGSGSSGDAAGSEGSIDLGMRSGFVQVSVEEFPLPNTVSLSYALSWLVGSTASGTVGESSVYVIESSGPSSAKGATIVTVPSKMASPI